MATEEYQIGYEAGYQDGWNEAQKPFVGLTAEEREQVQAESYGKAPIKMEGGIADPDEFEWDCICEDCKVKYQKWKEAYDIQQKQLRGEA